jgi:dTDP-4-dehydrorhamnose reductase
MKKLLVTGASGFLGWNLCHQAQVNWQVYGTYQTHSVEIPNVTTLKVDLRDLASLQKLFQLIKPDAVIHTAAASKPNFCQLNREFAYEINVTASINLAQLCAKLNIPCVFTSTDLVFDGKNPPYAEIDGVSPVSYYGEQKVTAEQKMLEIHPATAICRMPLMFGQPSPFAASFIQGFIENLQQGKELNLFTDEIRTPVSGSTASQGLLLAADQQISGILHLGGLQSISRYDFGLLLAEALGSSSDLIKPCLQQDVIMPAPRSPDTSLDSSKAFSQGYQPLTVREELFDVIKVVLRS